VYDGNFLPMTPLEFAASSREKSILLIIVNVEDEGSMYAFSPAPFFPVTSETLEKFFEQNKDWDRAAIDRLPCLNNKKKQNSTVIFLT